MTQEMLFGGRYRVLSVLGDGGMARVFKAQDERLGRLVAIKTLHQHYSTQPEFVARFQQEAQLAASLSHPNIIGVFDIGQDDGQHYIVMEYVEGDNLKSLIRRSAPLSLHTAIAICRQICLALDYAHAQGVIHRDIKPENIFLTPTQQVKVGDFGIARALAASNTTQTGLMLGSVHYISPEQAQGKQATARSDLYATGIVLYEMLTNHLPFLAENPLALVMQHIGDAPPPPTIYNPSLPVAVEAVVLKALAKDPAQRYATGAELAAALIRESASSAGMATPQRPPSQRPVQEHRPQPARRPVMAAPTARQQPRTRVRQPSLLAPILLLLLLVAGGGAIMHALIQPAPSSPIAGNASPTSRATATSLAVTATPSTTAVPTAARPSPVATRTPPSTVHTVAQPTPHATPTTRPAQTARPTATLVPTATVRPTPKHTPTAPSATPVVTTSHIARLAGQGGLVTASLHLAGSVKTDAQGGIVSYTAQKSFGTTKPMYAVIRLSNLPKKASVTVRWVMPDGTPIDWTPSTFWASASTHWTEILWSEVQPWTKGGQAYLRILVNNHVIGEAPFTIVAAAPTGAQPTPART